MRELIALLAALGCNPEARVVLDPHLEVPGYYRDGTVYLRSDASEGVARHECKHSRQKQAATQREWELNEREARLAELRERDD